MKQEKPSNSIFSMRHLLLLLLFNVAQCSQAQEIVVQGRIISSLDKKAVKASVQYKSYPTGGISGRMNDSTYTFSIFGSSKYLITVEADGFLPRTVIIDPKEAVDNRINRDVELIISGETVRLSHLNFTEGKAIIKDDSFTELDELVALMKGNPKIEIQLEGHTDSRGNAKANLNLSHDRADAVKKYLVSKGIERDRIKTKAFGGTNPIDGADTEEARNLNRRVEMRVLKF